MTNEKIARINELYKKSKSPEGLTPEEKIEQAELRGAFLEAVRKNLKGQLDNTVVIRPDGSSYRPADKDKSKK